MQFATVGSAKQPMLSIDQVRDQVKQKGMRVSKNAAARRIALPPKPLAPDAVRDR